MQYLSAGFYMTIEIFHLLFKWLLKILKIILSSPFKFMTFFLFFHLWCVCSKYIHTTCSGHIILLDMYMFSENFSFKNTTLNIMIFDNSHLNVKCQWVYSIISTLTTILIIGVEKINILGLIGHISIVILQCCPQNPNAVVDCM